MRIRRISSALALAVSATVLAPSAAFATNGYFAHGYSTKSNGLAGAGVAFPQDAMAAATNPAGMAFVGNRVDLGAAIFSPRREYTVEGTPTGACMSAAECTFGIGPQNIESDNDYFLMPHLGWSKPIDSQSTFGLSIYGNGGMNTEYRGGTATFGSPVDPATGTPVAVPPGVSVTAPGTFGAGTAGVDLMQLFIAPTYSRKINETAAWGIGPIFAIQRFEARGLGMFGNFGLSNAPRNLTNNGHDISYGAGVKLGVLGEVAPGLSLGASYQSRIYMTEFDDYKGLFAEKGDFDIPATATVGLAWNVTTTSTLVFDVQHIWYSDIDSIGNSLLPNLMNAQLGDDTGAGFGWDDMTIYKIGYQWQTSGGWTWRVGFSYGEQPIPESQVLFNILAPGVMERHFTFGFTKEMGKDNELSFAAMYAPKESVKGPNPLDPAQTIELEMEQYQIEFSWAWKF